MSAIPSIWTPSAGVCPSCGKRVRRAGDWLRRKRDWLRGLARPWVNYSGEDYVDSATGELIVDAATGKQDVNSSGTCCCSAGCGGGGCAPAVSSYLITGLEAVVAANYSCFTYGGAGCGTAPVWDDTVRYSSCNYWPANNGLAVCVSSTYFQLVELRCDEITEGSLNYWAVRVVEQLGVPYQTYWKGPLSTSGPAGTYTMYESASPSCASPSYGNLTVS